MNRRPSDCIIVSQGLDPIIHGGASEKKGDRPRQPGQRGAGLGRLLHGPNAVTMFCRSPCVCLPARRPMIEAAQGGPARTRKCARMFQPAPTPAISRPARHSVDRRQALGGRNWVAVRHNQHRYADANAGCVRGDKRHRDERIVDFGPRCSTGRAIDDDVIVDENGVEPDLLRLLRGCDDRLGRRLEAEVIRIGAAGRKPDGYDASRGVRC